MSDETELDVKIGAEVSGAADTKALAESVALVGDALRNLVSDAKSAVSATDKLERTLAATGSSSKSAKKDVDNLTNSLKEQAKVAKEVNATAKSQGNYRAPEAAGVLANPAKVVPSSIGNLSTAASRASQEATLNAQNQILKIQNKQNDALRTEISNRKQVVEQARAERLAAEQTAKAAANNARVQTGTGTGSAQAVAQRMQAAGTVGPAIGAQNAALAEANARVKTLRDSFGQYNDQLANTRYAMYGLSNALMIGGAALLVMNVGILKSASDFQTYNANIARTSQTSGAELANLESQFVQLGQTIPVSFDDLGAIETLGGQLGIASAQLTDFTRVTAEFSATTGVTADASATALGRLNQLIPGVNGNFEGLGSSILKVGLNSVATEQDIISVSSQIASAGVTAGLTADQIIGFSGAFASLGIKAEAARGTVIRVFGLMGKAVATGGSQLDEFAKVAGVSADEFKNTWGTSKFSDTFIKFLDGIDSQGTKAQLALSGLSITAARDQNNLLKLSQNTDLVTSSLGDASTGFSDATQLGDSFGKIAATVASQAKELWNALQGLFAELGSTGLGIIGGFIGMLKDMAVNFTELAKNPFVQSLVTVVGAFTALTGVALLLSSGILKVIAAFLAGRPVINLFNQTMGLAKARIEAVRIENGLAATSFGTLKASAIAAGVAVKGALISTVIGAGVVLALTAISAGWDAIAKATRSAADAGAEAFGDGSDLRDSLQKDTAAAKEGATVYNTVKGSIQTTSKATADWVTNTENATGGQVALSNATAASTKHVAAQTFAIGENTRTLLANKLANDKTIQALIQSNNIVAPKFQLNTTGFLTAQAKGDVAGAKKILTDYIANMNKLIAPGAIGGLTGDTAARVSKNIAMAEEELKAMTGYIDTATTKQQIMGIVADATGTQLGGMGGDADTAAEGMDAAAISASDLATAISSAFSGTNAVSQLAQDFYALSQSIIAGGDNFNVFSTQGQANVANLESAIGSAITAGQTMGVSATDSVSALFTALQAQGVNTAQLLASLANINIPGVNIGDVGKTVAGTKTLSTGAKILAVNLGSVGKQAKAASDALASKGGGGGGGGLGGAANDAAKEVRTLVDYANDLSGVLKRAFDIRFSGQQGMDTITKGWQDIADKTADANEKMQDARDTLQQLASDKSIDQYFLGIATAYGDTLRAADIQADLAKNATDTATANKDLANAQSDASKELVGNSKAAIQNRATLTGLVSNYEDYITALAASGADQATLTAKSAELKAQFIQQATQLGFNSAELGTYAVAFDDVHTAIDGVPRNITVDANTNPALQALNEFAAKAKQIAANAGSGAGNSFGSAMGDAVAAAASDIGNRAGLSLKSHFVGSLGTMAYSVVDASGQKVGGNTWDFFKTGGYTGDGSSSALAGAVHGKEFVVDASNTARLGLPFLNALNKGRTPAIPVAGGAGGGRGGIQITDLTAGTIAAIADAVSTIVLIGKDQVARASNAANLSGARRGANG